MCNFVSGTQHYGCYFNLQQINHCLLVVVFLVMKILQVSVTIIVKTSTPVCHVKNLTAAIFVDTVDMNVKLFILVVLKQSFTYSNCFRQPYSSSEQCQKVESCICSTEA